MCYHQSLLGLPWAGEGPGSCRDHFPVDLMFISSPGAEWDWAAYFWNAVDGRGSAVKHWGPFFFKALHFCICTQKDLLFFFFFLTNAPCEHLYASMQQREDEGRFDLFVQMKLDCLVQTTGGESVQVKWKSRRNSVWAAASGCSFRETEPLHPSVCCKIS